MAASFTRGAPSINLFFKPMMRKYCTKGSGGADTVREPTIIEAEEVKKMTGGDMGGNRDGSCSWVPDDRTGIYYPKGQEKVMVDVPAHVGKDTNAIHWFSYN